MSKQVIDHVKPLKHLLSSRRRERGLSREDLADALERLPGCPQGLDYGYLQWLEYYRTTIPKADEDRFWIVARYLCLTEDEILSSIMDGIRATIPASFRQ